jgi:lipid A 3-O-deacylase
MMKKTKFAAAIIAAACCFAARAGPPDSFSFEAGRGDDHADVWRAGLQWNWDKHWLEGRAWRLGAYWDLQFGQWTGPSAVTDVSLTPVFRYERLASTGARPYVEAAIGFHMLSDLRISPRRVFSTRFQFGDHVGIGVRFGERQRHDLSLRLQHVSNGGIRRPNPGINFWLLRYQRHFD